jgi:hypothetical protein
MKALQTSRNLLISLGSIGSLSIAGSFMMTNLVKAEIKPEIHSVPSQVNVDSSIINKRPRNIYRAIMNSRTNGNSKGSMLKTGERLLLGESLYSLNKQYEFAMQYDGNLVLYNLVNAKRIPLWSSRTEGNRVTGLVLQADGNLVIYNDKQQPIWATQTFDHHPTHHLHTLGVYDDGNVELYLNNYLYWTSSGRRTA